MDTFAITIGGNLFGIFGMFIAVPVFSVIYCTLGEVVNYRNEKRAVKVWRTYHNKIVRTKRLHSFVQPFLFMLFCYFT